MKYILIINGPNLNLLGRRQPEIYGNRTLDDINRDLAAMLADGLCLETAQYNSEGDIIDALHRAGFDPDCIGIALNAGAYTHYSYAIADAIAAISVPVVEVHMSNVHSRAEFRHRSVIAPVCSGTISGFGEKSYRLALEAIMQTDDKA